MKSFAILTWCKNSSESVTFRDKLYRINRI